MNKQSLSKNPSKRFFMPQSNNKSQSTQQRLLIARETNQKLSKLLQSMKVNMHIKSLQHSNRQSLMTNRQAVQLQKCVKNLQTQTTHLKHLENVLLSENKKLKEHVNNRRKERVIYSNIFKKYQKDIRIWEDKYKQTLLDSLSTQDAANKVKERIMKIKKRLQKEIKNLQLIKMQKQQQQLQQTQQKSKQKRMNQKPQGSQKSVKQIFSSKTLQQKNRDSELSFQHQSQLLLFNSLCQQLIQITQSSTIQQALQIYNNIDSTTEQVYQQYLQLQKDNKEKQNQLNLLQDQIRTVNRVSCFGTSNSIDGEDELKQLQNLIQQQEQQLIKLQQQVSLKLDVNCRKLTTQQLHPFIQRLKLSLLQSPAATLQKIVQNQCPQIKPLVFLKNQITPVTQSITQRSTKQLKTKRKNKLENKLEQVEKEKSVNSYLLTYDQINRSLLQQYTKKDQIIGPLTNRTNNKIYA